MSRKLDAAIATELGWTDIGYKNYSWGMSKWWGKPPKSKEERFGDERDYKDIPHYSTDGNAMLELDREMRERGYGLAIFAGTNAFNARYASNDGDLHESYADTMPEAVTLAAYHALTGKEWTP